MNFDEIFKNLSLPMILHRLEGNVASANKATASLLGSESPEDLEGRSIYDFVRPIDRANLAEAISKAVEESQPFYDLELFLVREESGNFLVNINGSPTSSGDEVLFALEIREVELEKAPRVAAGAEPVDESTEQEEAEKGIPYITSDVRSAIKLMFVYGSRLMRVAIENNLEGTNVKYKAAEFPGGLDAEEWSDYGPDLAVFGFSSCGEEEAEVIKEVVSRDRRLPVLLMCLSITDQLAQDLIKSGVRGIISQEGDFKLLPQAITSVYNGELWCPRVTLQSVIDDYRSVTVAKRGGQGHAPLLTGREIEVLRLIAKSFRNKDIAKELGVSYSTVVSHVYNIFRKLEVNNRVEAIQYAISNRIIDSM